MTYEELAERLKTWAHRGLDDAMAATLVHDAAERAFGDLWIPRPLPAVQGDPLPPLYDPTDELPFQAVFLSAAMVALRQYESDAEGQAMWDLQYGRDLMSALRLGATQHVEPGLAPQVVVDGGFDDGP